jgi:hypothetical protein
MRRARDRLFVTGKAGPGSPDREALRRRTDHSAGRSRSGARQDQSRSAQYRHEARRFWRTPLAWRWAPSSAPREGRLPSSTCRRRSDRANLVGARPRRAGRCGLAGATSSSGYRAHPARRSGSAARMQPRRCWGWRRPGACRSVRSAVDVAPRLALTSRSSCQRTALSHSRGGLSAGRSPVTGSRVSCPGFGVSTPDAYGWRQRTRPRPWRLSHGEHVRTMASARWMIHGLGRDRAPLPGSTIEDGAAAARRWRPCPAVDRQYSASFSNAGKPLRP